VPGGHEARTSACRRRRCAEATVKDIGLVDIEKVRKETVYAPESVRRGLLDWLHRSKARARDAWLEGRQPRHPTQFAPVAVLDELLA
jgi:hypothetical protein